MRYYVTICTFLCFSLTYCGCNKNGQTGDEDKSNMAQNDPIKNEEEEEDFVAGIKVKKFDYTPKHKYTLFNFDSRTNDLRKIFIGTGNITFANKFPTISTGINNINKEDINAVTKDKLSVLFIAAYKFFPEFQIYTGLSEIKKLNEEITIPLLKKGLNPNLKSDLGETVKDVIASSEFTNEQKNYLLEPIDYYEPSESVRDALAAIAISLNNIKDPNLDSKKILNNLRKLTPYFIASGSQNLASEIVNKFSNAKLDSKKVFSTDVNKEAKDFIDGLRNESQKFTDIGNLSLQGALAVLRTLADL